ncbi:MAG: hypothetical protein ACRYFE_06030 [Janthinobacterium lividum]
MSQHNIIGSEAFDGRRYIIVRQVRSGIGRRRRRPALVLTIVAIMALLAGATVAVFALAPLLAQNNAPAATLEPSDMRDQMRMQPVEPAEEATAQPSETPQTSPAA